MLILILSVALALWREAGCWSKGFSERIWAYVLEGRNLGKIKKIKLEILEFLVLFLSIYKKKVWLMYVLKNHYNITQIVWY